MRYIISEQQYNFIKEQITAVANTRYVEVKGPYELSGGQLLNLNSKETSLEPKGEIIIIWYIQNVSKDVITLQRFNISGDMQIPRTKLISNNLSKKADGRGNITLNPNETINWQIKIQSLGSGDKMIGVTWQGNFGYTPPLQKSFGVQGMQNQVGQINLPKAEFNVPNLTENELPQKIDPFNPHVWFPILGIAATAMFPAIGPFIAAGLSVGESAIYYREGDKKTAGMMFMFSLIPGIGPIINKIPGAKTLGVKGMEQLGKKIAMGSGALSNVEKQVASWISKNSEFVTSSVRQEAAKIASTQAAKTTGNVAKGLLSAAGTLGGYAAAGTAYNKVYDKATSGSPENQAAKEGFDWGNIKNMFGVENKNDESLLINAWKEGWRPGKIVPEKYQTLQYKKDLQSEG